MKIAKKQSSILLTVVNFLHLNVVALMQLGILHETLINQDTKNAEAAILENC